MKDDYSTETTMLSWSDYINDDDQARANHNLIRLNKRMLIYAFALSNVFWAIILLTSIYIF